MKKYMILFAAVLLAACSREESPRVPGNDETVVPARKTLTFTADAIATKTELGDDWSVSWCEGDEVKIVWNGGDATCPVVLEGGKAYFSAVVDEVKEYYAVYPADTPAQVSADGNLSVTLPSSQSGLFKDCAIIVAHTTRDALNFGRFKSAVGMVRFSIKDPAVTRVRFASPDNALVTGSVVAGSNLSLETIPVGSSVDVAVNGAGTYFLSVLPGVQIPGVSFQLGNAEKWMGTASSQTPASIKAGQVLLVSASLEDNLIIEGDIYISEPEALRSLLSNPASASKLDGHTVHVSAGTYDLAIGDKGLVMELESAATVKIEAEEGTVFTTSLSGEEGCILTVASDNVNLDIEGVTFTGGKHNGTGGALCLTKGKHSFRGCVFSNNETTSTLADKTGGAVYVGGSATAGFEGCTFSGNNTYITGGGALAVYSTGLVTLFDCDFTGNKTYNGTAYVGNGGAILQKKAGNVMYVVNCRFSGNGTNTNGPDVFSSAGDALMLYNTTFAHPLYPAKNSLNRGLVRVNAPAFVASCTFIMDVDETTKGAGCNNGVLAFSQNNNNVIAGNLMLSNAGYSMGAGTTYTNSTTKKATTKGYNVYSEAPKIVLTDEGNGTDLTGKHTADVVAVTELSADGLLHWDGPAAKLSGYQAATTEGMASIIKSYPVGGEAFYNWLVAKDVFGKDANGNPRGNSWWPGAYQGE